MCILALLMAAALLFNTAAIAQDVVFLESAKMHWMTMSR